MVSCAVCLAAGFMLLVRTLQKTRYYHCEMLMLLEETILDK